MRTLAAATQAWGFDGYDARWEEATRDGFGSIAFDTRLQGWRYLSLNALLLPAPEAARLARLTEWFGRLVDWAVPRLLEDPDWWSVLAWPRPAIELARQEPDYDGAASVYGRFDWLLDREGQWQLVEYNSDTPSGSREVCGLEPAVLRLHREAVSLERLEPSFQKRVENALRARMAAFERATGNSVRTVGVVSSHSWVEDMAHAWWLARTLEQTGVTALVGDISDLSVRHGRVRLRGLPIDALYRLYPFERLYRHGIFGPLVEATLDRRLLLLNGLRGFLAQSKAILAYLWLHRQEQPWGRRGVELVESHLPAAVPARHPDAGLLLPDSVVKHVNGREGEEVVFGADLTPEEWEARLIEGGYVVQRRVDQRPVENVEVDEIARSLELVAPRYACVGAFRIGGHFAGCYSRVGGPITQNRAPFVPTFREVDAARR